MLRPVLLEVLPAFGVLRARTIGHEAVYAQFGHDQRNCAAGGLQDLIVELAVAQSQPAGVMRRHARVASLTVTCAGIVDGGGGILVQSQPAIVGLCFGDSGQEMLPHFGSRLAGAEVADYAAETSLGESRVRSTSNSVRRLNSSRLPATGSL